MSLAVTKTVIFFALHGGPANHFATFTEELSKEGIPVQIYAAGPARDVFTKRGIKLSDAFDLEHLDAIADQIAKTNSVAHVILTDVGHFLDVNIHQAFEARGISHFAYYDNPEPYVPGGYSEVAARVMSVAQGVLFANANLVETVDTGDKPKIGIGYYPLEQARELAKMRKEGHVAARAEFLREYGIEDRGQKVLVYFGGNNTEYFDHALPAFLTILQKSAAGHDMSNLVIILQQHPGAKAEKKDETQVREWIERNKELQNAPNGFRVVISNFDSTRAQLIAEGALYYQTSMGPQFVLAGVPTVQIGHEVYADILVRNQLVPSITNAAEFQAVMENFQTHTTPPESVILAGLGIRGDWFQNLKQAMGL